MRPSIVIFAVIPPGNEGDLWKAAGIKLREGIFPKHISFSVSSNTFIHYQAKMADFVHDSELYIFEEDSAHRYALEQLQLNNHYPRFSIKEIAMILFPTTGQLESSNLLTARHKVRLDWELLKLCWNKGLNQDLGFISHLTEAATGLECEPFLRKIKREIIKQHPDKLIRTSPRTRRDFENNLFTREPKETEAIPYEQEWVKSCFAAGGLLSQSMNNYEHRSIQAQMVQVILQGFTKGQNVMIEAGTGTGKTIAYLLPALWWAKRMEKRIIIATYTITLQEQIFSKDIPSLEGILPFASRAALLKGRSHYVCQRSVSEKKGAQKSLSRRDALERAILISWLEETNTGDFGELSHLDIQGLARRLGCDHRECFPAECFFSNSCFYLAAKKSAEEADVVVVNHSLLLADIKTNNRVIPAYDTLIIDEAHNLYPTALKQLGFELSAEQVIRLMEILDSNDRGGLLKTIIGYSRLWSEIHPDKQTGLEQIINHIKESVTSILEQSASLFHIVHHTLHDRTNLLIDEESMGQQDLSIFTVNIENLLNRFETLVSHLDSGNMSVLAESQQFAALKYDITRYKQELGVVTEGLRSLIRQAADQINYLDKTNTCYVKSCPSNIAAILKEEIFSKIECAVLVSATMTVNNSFNYMAADVGIDNYLELKLDSTFNYDEQMLFCVVDDLGNDSTEEGRDRDIAEFIQEISMTMGGRTLVLFTSHRALHAVHHRICSVLKDQGFRLLSQGISGNRETLIKEFIETPNSILMGTNTFWEGIDIPGDSLKCVIMAKLPFSSPDTPVIKAKSRWLKKLGEDPFSQLLLPEAVIRFKQGFGRLIRTKYDQGVVVLLDNRIVKKSYGKFFIKSIPISSYYKGNARKVIKEAEKWR